MFNAVNKSLSGSLVSALNGIAFLSPTKNHHSSPYPLPASSSSTLCESSKYLKEIHCSVTKVSFTCTQTGLTQSKCPTQWEVLKFGYVKKESTKVLSCLNFLVEGRKQLCRSPPSCSGMLSKSKCLRSTGTVAGQGLHTQCMVSELLCNSPVWRFSDSPLKVKNHRTGKSKGFNTKNIPSEILKH